MILLAMSENKTENTGHKYGHRSEEDIFQMEPLRISEALRTIAA